MSATFIQWLFLNWLLCVHSDKVYTIVEDSFDHVMPLTCLQHNFDNYKYESLQERVFDFGVTIFIVYGYNKCYESSISTPGRRHAVDQTYFDIFNMLTVYTAGPALMTSSVASEEYFSKFSLNSVPSFVTSSPKSALPVQLFFGFSSSSGTPGHDFGTLRLKTS